MGAVGETKSCGNVFDRSLRGNEHMFCQSDLDREIVLIRRFAEFSLQDICQSGDRHSEMLGKFAYIQFVAHMGDDVFFVFVTGQSVFAFDRCRGVQRVFDR